MTVTFGNVSPLTVAPTLSIPLTFGSTSFVNTTAGSYSPNNDTKTLHTFSTTSDLPRWFLLVVDGPITVTVTTSSAHTPANQLPIQRMLFMGSPTPLNNYSTIALDGTNANVNYVPTQNVAINYSLWWGDSSVS